MGFNRGGAKTLRWDLVDGLPGFWEMPDLGCLSDDFVSFFIGYQSLILFFDCPALPGHCPMIAR